MDNKPEAGIDFFGGCGPNNNWLIIVVIAFCAFFLFKGGFGILSND